MYWLPGKPGSRFIEGESMGSKLHELLAVEGDLKAEKMKIGQEALKTFSTKANLFQGFHKELKMVSEERQIENKEDHLKLETTVPKKLDYISKFFKRFWDARLQKEKTNQKAVSDLIVINNDGVEQIKIENLPVTFLLSMEEEIKELRKILSVIPTLETGVEWVVDDQEGQDVYKTARPDISTREEKKVVYDIPVQATKEHPAQVRDRMTTEVVGKYTSFKWSGMISPADKHALMERADLLLKAIKKARMRGNDIEVEKGKIGTKLFGYLFGK